MLYHLLFADTYAVLSNMGVEVPIEHLEKTFKINGLKYKENYGFGFGLNLQGAQEFAKNAQSLETNAKPNAQSQRLLNKANSLYADEFERFFAEFKEQNADFDFEKFESIFENSSSFENAEKALIKAFDKSELEKIEQILMNLAQNAQILGFDDGGENE